MRARGFSVRACQALLGEFPNSARYLCSRLSPATHPLDCIGRFTDGAPLLRFPRVLRTGLHARLLRRQWRFVVLDFPAEVLLDSMQETHGCMAVLRLLGPEPDLAILLDAPGEVRYARKGDHPVQILEPMRAGYQALLPRVPERPGHRSAAAPRPP